MKKCFYIVTVLMIINLLLIIYLIIYNSKLIENNEEPNEMITVPGEDLSFELNNKIFPKNYLDFERLSNNTKVDKDEIYKALYVIIKNASTVYLDTVQMSAQEINEYYQNNKDQVVNKMGIFSEEDFIKIVSLLKNVYVGDNVYYRNIEILTETFNRDNGITCEFDIEFNNNKIIKLKLVIDNYNSETFKFIPIMEE